MERKTGKDVLRNALAVAMAVGAAFIVIPMLFDHGQDPLFADPGTAVFLPPHVGALDCKLGTPASRRCAKIADATEGSELRVVAPTTPTVEGWHKVCAGGVGVDRNSPQNCASLGGQSVTFWISDADFQRSRPERR